MSFDPIRHEYVVDCSPDRAFDAYANRMSEWWDPKYTADPETFEGVSIDPRLGGEVIETHRGDQREGEQTRQFQVPGLAGDPRAVRCPGGTLRRLRLTCLRCQPRG